MDAVEFLKTTRRICNSLKELEDEICVKPQK